jgi:hypothetical protein
MQLLPSRTLVRRSLHASGYDHRAERRGREDGRPERVLIGKRLARNEENSKGQQTGSGFDLRGAGPLAEARSKHAITRTPSEARFYLVANGPNASRHIRSSPEPISRRFSAILVRQALESRRVDPLAPSSPEFASSARPGLFCIRSPWSQERMIPPQLQVR